MTCCSVTVDDRVFRAASLNEVWFQSFSAIDCVLYAPLTTVHRLPLMDARSRSHVSNTHQGPNQGLRKPLSGLRNHLNF